MAIAVVGTSCQYGKSQEYGTFNQTMSFAMTVFALNNTMKAIESDTSTLSFILIHYFVYSNNAVIALSQYAVGRLLIPAKFACYCDLF